MAKGSGRKQLRLSGEELREVHLALALRLAHLTKVNTKKMGPNAKAKHQHEIDVSKEVHATVQKARGK
jgi:hypothetical protein